MSELRILLIFVFTILINKSKNVDLNNIGEYINDILPLQMPNKDFVFLSIDQRRNSEGNRAKFILIYALKSSGESFGDNIIEIININSGKYLSTLLIIGNNKYPLICDLTNCLSLDLRNVNYNSKDFHSLLQEVTSGENYCGHIINLDNKS